MKIAVACQGDQVSEHFGHCESLRVYDIMDGVIQSQESITNPGHLPGYLPGLLADRGASVLITGGIGEGALSLLKDRQIGVIAGAQGSSLDAVTAWCRGGLETTGAVCREHQHSDTCGQQL
ncbi:MAG: NifB/NifX family molybdenum-iron cluster-binding protein [Christensenellales bacterium]